MNLCKNHFISKSKTFIKNKTKDRWKKWTTNFVYLSSNIFYSLLVLWILITHKCDASSDVDYLMDMETETTSKTEVYIFINRTYIIIFSIKNVCIKHNIGQKN